MDGAQFERTSYGLRFEKTGLSGVLKELKASAFYNYADHVMDNYTLRTPNPLSAMPMPMASNVDRLTRGGRAAATWRLATLDITTGFDTQRSRHRQRSAMGEGAYRETPWTTDANFSNTGVFAEATWRAREYGKVVFGDDYKDAKDGGDKGAKREPPFIRKFGGDRKKP